MKNGFTPREVPRFLFAEKSDSFCDSSDVSHSKAVLMKMDCKTARIQHISHASNVHEI
jgi:hypothetical protein